VDNYVPGIHLFIHLFIILSVISVIFNIRMK
jgi:hypothetical protein